jgi:hypothetical protein
VVTEEQIQALETRGLLRPKVFPTEETGESVIFLAHIERGFGVPAGDFFRGLL